MNLNDWFDRQDAWQTTPKKSYINWLDLDNNWQTTSKKTYINWLDLDNNWQTTSKKTYINWLDLDKNWQKSIQTSPEFSRLSSYLSTSNISEINQIIRDYKEDSTIEEMTVIEESENNNPTQLRDFTEAQLTEFIDSRITKSQKSSNFIKTLVEEVKLNYGVEAVKWIISTLLIPLLFYFISSLTHYHEEIINMIQQNSESNDSGIVSIKKFIKKSGLSNYENINYIGVIRVDSTIRVSNSKHSPLAVAQTIEANTVVNIISRKGNWIKIELIVNNKIVTAWIEESKIIKFKRK